MPVLQPGESFARIIDLGDRWQMPTQSGHASVVLPSKLSANDAADVIHFLELVVKRISCNVSAFEGPDESSHGCTAKSGGEDVVDTGGECLYCAGAIKTGRHFCDLLCAEHFAEAERE